MTDLTRRAYAHYVPMLGGEPMPMTEDYAPRIAGGQVWVLETRRRAAGLIVLEAPRGRATHLSASPSRPSIRAQRPRADVCSPSQKTSRADTRLRKVDLFTNAKMERNIAIYRRFGFVEIAPPRASDQRQVSIIVDMEKHARPPAEQTEGLTEECAFFPIPTQDRADMLATIGVAAIDELFSDIPPAKRLKAPLDLPKHKSELEVSPHSCAGWRRKNHAAGDGPFFVGAGAYRHHVPAAVDHIIQRSEFLTSYTPYQPEIAQGTLQYLFEFQTQVANLTGMEVANASMYDGSTATAEAVLMAHRVTRRRKAVLSGGLHPHYRETVETVSRMAGDTLVALDPDPRGTEDILAAIDDETSCVVVQSPSFYGQLIDLEADRREGACERRAARRRLHRGGLARPARAAGRAGRRHRRRRGPGDRQCAEFRRPLCRPLRDAAEIHPPDAGPALRA